MFLDRVEPRGGGTLAVAGAHRLVERVRASRGEESEGRSAEVRKALRRAVPWLRELWSPGDSDDRIGRFMGESGSFEGVSLRVVELTGEAGDAVLMHPWMVHAPAQNCGERARIVLTERFRTLD